LHDEAVVIEENAQAVHRQRGSEFLQRSSSRRRSSVVVVGAR
jgi:hypothetical protein